MNGCHIFSVAPTLVVLGRVVRCCPESFSAAVERGWSPIAALDNAWSQRKSPAFSPSPAFGQQALNMRRLFSRKQRSACILFETDNPWATKATRAGERGVIVRG